MSIDEARPHLPSMQIDRVRRAAERLEGGDAAVDDSEIEANEPFRIGRPGSRGQKRGGHRSLGEGATRDKASRSAGLDTVAASR
jgi:hypothetical protein